MAQVYADDRLRESIESFIKDRFGPGDIMSVRVDEDGERDGMLVLDITVEFRGTPSELARREPSGFLSKLRAHVSEMHHAFPVVRFRPAVLQEA